MRARTLGPRAARRLDRKPPCRPRTGPLAVEGRARRDRLRILQSTSTAFCVVRKPLKTRRRGFDDSSSPSASRDILFSSLRAAESPQNAGLRGYLSEPRAAAAKAASGHFPSPSLSLSLSALPPMEPNHGRFGTDVRNSQNQWVSSRPCGRGFERAALRRSEHGSNIRFGSDVRMTCFPCAAGPLAARVPKHARPIWRCRRDRTSVGRSARVRRFCILVVGDDSTNPPAPWRRSPTTRSPACGWPIPEQAVGRRGPSSVPACARRGHEARTEVLLSHNSREFCVHPQLEGIEPAGLRQLLASPRSTRSPTTGPSS